MISRDNCIFTLKVKHCKCSKITYIFLNRAMYFSSTPFITLFLFFIKDIKRLKTISLKVTLSLILVSYTIILSCCLHTVLRYKYQVYVYSSKKQITEKKNVINYNYHSYIYTFVQLGERTKFFAFPFHSD